MREQGLVLHESIELHELLTIKNVSLTKALTMQILVSDNELKEIMQQEVITAREHIEELKDLLQHVNYE